MASKVISFIRLDSIVGTPPQLSLQKWHCSLAQLCMIEPVSSCLSFLCKSLLFLFNSYSRLVHCDFSSAQSETKLLKKAIFTPKKLVSFYCVKNQPAQVLPNHDGFQTNPEHFWARAIKKLELSSCNNVLWCCLWGLYGVNKHVGLGVSHNNERKHAVETLLFHQFWRKSSGSREKHVLL